MVDSSSELSRRRLAHQHVLPVGQRQPMRWVRTAMYEREYQREAERTQERRNSAPELDISSNGKEDGKSTGHPDPTKSPIEYFRDLTSRMIRKRSGAVSRSKPHKQVIKPPGDVLRRSGTAPLRESRFLNVVNFMAAGHQFQCPEYIFHNHPDTLLGSEQRRHKYFNPRNHSFSFPHTLPDVFTSILDYYQTGVLVKPERLTLNYFLENIELFNLEQPAVDAMLVKEGVFLDDQYEELELIRGKAKTRLNSLWNVLDKPWTSKIARIYSFFSLFMTILSVLLYVIETLPELERFSLVGKKNLKEAYASPLTIINTICFMFFTIEFVLRFVSCPNKRKFVRTWTNWTDLFSIVPFIVLHLVMIFGSADPKSGVSVSILNVVRACRLFLISRVLGTSRYYRQQWIIILTTTLWNNIETLFILFMLLIICMVGFGGLIYAVEPANISTIPVGMWWAVITMTTVGFGDVVPTTAFGRLLAVACGCVGLMFIGFVLESVTYEYHRLMRSNTQYLKYLQDQKLKKDPVATYLTRQETVDLGRFFEARRNLPDDAPEIQVSVNGAHFNFALTDLGRHPGTLLSHPSKRAHYFNPTTGSYFFPRNQDIFPSIHAYYTDPGEPLLKRPPFVSMQRFVEEAEFFQLRPQAIIDLFASEGIILIEEKQPKNQRQGHWHMVFEHPRYSCLSYFIHLISLLTTVTFILTIVLETIPSLLNPDCALSLGPFAGNHTISNTSGTWSSCTGEKAFFFVDSICTAWFTFELVSRFLVSASKCDFAKDLMNYFDLLAILPFVCTAVQLSSQVSPSHYVEYGYAFNICRTLRLIRLVGVLRFSRYFRRIQMIFAILRSTWTELMMLCYFMLINSIIFGTLIYMIETNPSAKEPSKFTSIPRGMYWAWITMLTIGYGDFYPITPGGQVVGSACAILGIVFWTLPMTLISDHFASYRRLYESQDYMMRCLTRMYHLRDSERLRRIKSTHCLVELAEADKSMSPDTVLLVEEPDRGKVIWSKKRLSTSRSPRPPSEETKQRSIGTECSFPRLHFKESVISRG